MSHPDVAGIAGVMRRRLAHLRSRGFVGPRYSGIIGRARFVFQHLVVRREVVLVATSASAVRGPVGDIVLKSIRSAEELAPYRDAVDAAYHDGYSAAWLGPLGWGEELFLALEHEDPVGFGWVQHGDGRGLASYHGPLARGDRRVLRVGVLPHHRRRGVNRMFYRALLAELFARGAGRVYIDCSRDNTPSLAAQLSAGFQPVGEVDVSGSLVPGTWIRWRPASALDDVRIPQS